jgi:hypothetical protein
MSSTMERLFTGAYIVACREIGMKEQLPKDSAGQSADDQAKTSSAGSPPSLRPRPRPRLPHDGPRLHRSERRKTKVWVMLGWEQANCTLGYVKNPGIKSLPRRQAGRFRHAERRGPEIHPRHRYLATPSSPKSTSQTPEPHRIPPPLRHLRNKAAILANLE